MFNWFIDSLNLQIDNIIKDNIKDKIQIIVVDGFLNKYNNSNRREYFINLINNKYDLTHVQPKPTKWQGEYKITPDNYFAASNTRNTGVCYAKHPYIAFVDDLGVLSNTWLEQVVQGSISNKIYCGAYTKVKDIIVNNGKYISGDITGGVDSRLSCYSDDISKCTGQHMFGSSFCMPLCWYFEVNGQNEMCDGIAGEDYDLGLRLERNGKELYYNKKMFIHESDYVFGSDKERKCIRSDPEVDINTYQNVFNKYNIPLILSPRLDLSHFMLYYGQYGPIRVNTDFSLEEYNHNIVCNKYNPDNIFLKPDCNYIHFFTNKSIIYGLL